MAIRIKRVYEQRSEEDGFRVLIDRLWPRGCSKGDASIDLWLRDLAPSTALRTWFAHDPSRWTEFRRRYHTELKAQAASLAPLLDRARRGVVTLVYSARDEEHNQAAALQLYLSRLLRRKTAGTRGGRATPVARPGRKR